MPRRRYLRPGDRVAYQALEDDDGRPTREPPEWTDLGTIGAEPDGSLWVEWDTGEVDDVEVDGRCNIAGRRCRAVRI